MSRQALKNDGVIDPTEFAAVIATVDRQAKAKTIITKNYGLFKKYRDEEYSFQNIVDVIKKVMAVKISESGFRKAYRALEKKRAEEAGVRQERQNAVSRSIPKPVDADVVDDIDVDDIDDWEPVIEDNGEAFSQEPEPTPEPTPTQEPVFRNDPGGDGFQAYMNGKWISANSDAQKKISGVLNKAASGGEVSPKLLNKARRIKLEMQTHGIWR